MNTSFHLVLTPLFFFLPFLFGCNFLVVLQIRALSGRACEILEEGVPWVRRIFRLSGFKVGTHNIYPYLGNLRDHEIFLGTRLVLCLMFVRDIGTWILLDFVLSTYIQSR